MFLHGLLSVTFPCPGTESSGYLWCCEPIRFYAGVRRSRGASAQDFQVPPENKVAISNSAPEGRAGPPFIYLLYSRPANFLHGFYPGFYGFLRFSLLNSRFFLRLFPFPETRRITVIRRRTCALTRHVRTYT
jgi:hypothetical protein